MRPKSRYVSSVCTLLLACVWVAGCSESAGEGPEGQFGQSRAELRGPLRPGPHLQRVAGSNDYSLFLGPNGTVWSAGCNWGGQLGNGTYTRSDTPVQVSNLTGIVDVAASTANQVGVALRGDGTVWAWGADGAMLGNGGTTASTVPVQVSNLTEVVDIAVGNGHVLALKSDGTVWAWGANYQGQLGNGSSTVVFRTPQQVSNLTNVVQVAAGSDASLAIKADGALWFWGLHADTSIVVASSPVPVQVSGISDVVLVQTPGQAMYALKADGTLWSWGTNNWGILGDGTLSPRFTPAQVLSDVVSFEAGYWHVLAVKANGTVWSWGFNAHSELGYGTGDNYSALPQQVPSLSNVVEVSGGYLYSLALKSDNTVWGWGSNQCGEFGVATGGGNFLTPLQSEALIGLSGVVDVAGGSLHSLALKSDGTVRAWGSNASGQLGNGTTTNQLTPVQVSNLSNVVAIAAGGNHSLALLSNGVMRSWGANASGQLGSGNTTNRLSPGQVFSFSGVVAIAAGANHSLALKNDGSVWGWGDNAYGQLGQGSNTADQLSPVQITALSGIVAIAAGSNHSMALKSDGSVWTFGYNVAGQIGNGTTSNKLNPGKVAGLSNVLAISAWGNLSMALLADGTVRAWGANASGQVGDGTTTNRLTPVPVSNLSGVQAISAGANHAMALTSDGTVMAWGDNAYGQLGNGTTTDSLTPVQVPNLIRMKAIEAGSHHSLALTSAGTARTWGYNSAGQVGNGTTNNRLSPFVPSL